MYNICIKFNHKNMVIPKIPKKYLIPVAILAILLLALVIYLFTKDSKKSEDQSKSKTSIVKISEVNFSDIPFYPSSCAEYVKTYFPPKESNEVTYKSNPEAEKKLNTILTETKKYTSFALKDKGYYPSDRLQNYYEIFVNDSTHTDYYNNGKEEYTRRTVTIEDTQSSINAKTKEITQNETSSNEEKDILSLYPATTLETLTNLQNKSVKFDERSKENTLYVTGKSSSSFTGATLYFNNYIQITFKDNKLESIQKFTQPENGADESTCSVRFIVYSNLGDKFEIVQPK